MMPPAARAPKQPTVVVIAGPNGAGKSTAATFLLKQALGILEFVNADQIATGLSAYAPETVAFEAGRIMLKRLRDLAAAGVSFAVIIAGLAAVCLAAVLWQERRRSA